MSENGPNISRKREGFLEKESHSSLGVRTVISGPGHLRQAYRNEQPVQDQETAKSYQKQ